MTIQKYDWERVRVEYIQGHENGGGLERPTLEQLAQEYSIPAATIRSRAHRENWAGERNDFHTSLIHKTREKTLEQLAEKAAQLDLQAFSVARAMFAVAAKKLGQDMDGDTLSLSDRERLLRICDTAHKLGRRALGTGGTSE